MNDRSLSGVAERRISDVMREAGCAALFAAGRTPSGLKRGRCAENRFGKSASLPVAIWRLGRPRSILSPTLDPGGAVGIEAPFNQRGRLDIRLGAAGWTAPRLSS